MIEVFSYRDNELGFRVRRDELIAERAFDATTLRVIENLYARRVSRMAGGIAAMFGIGCVLAVALLTRGVDVVGLPSPFKLALTPILIVSWVLVPCAMIAARFGATIAFRRATQKQLLPSADARHDVIRFEAQSIASWAASKVDALEEKSVSLPLAGCALMLPLSLHLGLAMLVMGRLEVEGFDFWILASIILTAVAHGTLACISVSFAKKLRAATPEAQVPSIWSPLGWTIIAGCLPGVVLYLVPPLIVAVTGFVFIAPTFGLMKHRIFSERGTLSLFEFDMNARASV